MGHWGLPKKKKNLGPHGMRIPKLFLADEVKDDHAQLFKLPLNFLS